MVGDMANFELYATMHRPAQRTRQPNFAAVLSIYVRCCIQLASISACGQAVDGTDCMAKLHITTLLTSTTTASHALSVSLALYGCIGQRLLFTVTADKSKYLEFI